MYNKAMPNEELKKIMKTLTILYVEDEDSIRKNLTETLKLIFKEVISVDSAEDAIAYYKEKIPDLVLSDIGLKNLNGIELAKYIRNDNHDIPIILITAHVETEILLAATKLKLIDYLTKPVGFDELFEALLKATKDIVRQGMLLVRFSENCYYDINKQVLIKDKQEVKLTFSEQKLLNVFLSRRGKTISKEEIKIKVWDDPFDVTENAFKSLLNKLRTKIGKSSIKNVSSVGYFLVTL